MPVESTTETSQGKETQTKEAVKLGSVERVSLSVLPTNEGETNQESADSAATTATTTAEDTTKGEAAKPPTSAALTEDQIKNFFESQGIKYEGLDKLKEKINYTAPVEPTAEEKQKQEAAQEKRRLDYFIAGGGTAEQYVSLKQLAESDLAKLSIDTVRSELKIAGFSDSEVDELIRERYYQIEEDEIEKFDDETEKAFAKRKKEFFATKLATRATHTKSQATSILEGLNEMLKSEDSQAQQELTLSANIDEQFKAMPRKLTHAIGEDNGETIPPVQYEVPEAALSEIQSTWKDPAKRQQFLYNKDGSLNVAKLIEIQVRNIALESAIKAAYHESGTRQLAKLEKVFPKSALELGVGGGGKKPNDKGAIASSGKPQRTHLQHTN